MSTSYLLPMVPPMDTTCGLSWLDSVSSLSPSDPLDALSELRTGDLLIPVLIVEPIDCELLVPALRIRLLVLPDPRSVLDPSDELVVVLVPPLPAVLLVCLLLLVRLLPSVVLLVLVLPDMDLASIEHSASWLPASMNSLVDPDCSLPCMLSTLVEQ